MKNNKRFVKTCISTIYLHGWFVPLFLLLIGIKICLLSLIADAIRERQVEHRLHHESVVAAQVLGLHHHQPRAHHRIKVKHKETGARKTFSAAGRRTTNPPENVVAPVPDNLLELEINPTGKNRTSSTSVWLIYNSVPECGEDQAVQLLEKLARANGFSHQQHEYQTPWPRFLLEKEQESLVQWFQYHHQAKSYNRHFFFVNFTKYQKYNKEKPIYINFVRDPIDRLVLDYYSKRNMSSAQTKQEIARRNAETPGSGTEWYHRSFEDCVLQADPECRYTAGEKSFTLMIPFFCGQHNSCVVINDRWALQMAKFNIESEYSVVGVLEKMDQTLTALENFVPTFFHGATHLHNELSKLSRLSSSQSGKRVAVSSYVRQIMESELYNEVELYQFIRRRLAIQYLKLSSNS